MTHNDDEPDWLLYLPASAGNPDFLKRAAAHLEEMRLRVESEGGRIWLDRNHDSVTRIFLISEFRVLGPHLFVTGEWTEEGKKERRLYLGLSPDTIVLLNVGYDLLPELQLPKDCISSNNLHEFLESTAHHTDDVRGLVGAACLDVPPAFGITGIYRLARNETTGCEWARPFSGIFAIEDVPTKPKPPKPKQTMNYILQRSFLNGEIVLVSDWAREGAQFRRDSTLPHQSALTAGEFVREQLLNPGGDPSLGCDEPDKLRAYGWEFLTTGLPPEWVKLLDLNWELRTNGVALPPVQLGPSEMAM